MICDAARATSAAWTYFPLMKIGQRFFADGGVECNNPSFTIWDHYTQGAEMRRIRGQRYSQSQETPPPIPTHPGVDFSSCRIVNIGTGSNIDGETPPRERDKLASFVPGWILYGIFLKTTLTKVATAADREAYKMKTMQQVRQGELVFNRLSASNGVCWIKLDDYLKLDEITRLTNEWLQERKTRDMMLSLANDMAREYLETHPLTNTNAGSAPDPQEPANEDPTNTQTTPSEVTIQGEEPQASSEIPKVQIQLVQDSTKAFGDPNPTAAAAAATATTRPTWLSTDPHSTLRSQSV